MNAILVRPILCEAIQKRALIRFRYEDHRVRIVEPHLVGENTARHEALVGWLVRGETIDASHRPGWRNYLLHLMQSVELLDESFERPRPKYNRHDKHMVRVYCCLP